NTNDNECGITPTAAASTKILGKSLQVLLLHLLPSMIVLLYEDELPQTNPNLAPTDLQKTPAPAENRPVHTATTSVQKYNSAPLNVQTSTARENFAGDGQLNHRSAPEPVLRTPVADSTVIGADNATTKQPVMK
ncbi:hypothetical protein NECAME_15263, partial [Necator americanus]